MTGGMFPFLAAPGLELPLIQLEPIQWGRSKEERRSWLYDTLPSQARALHTCRNEDISIVLV